MSDATTPTTDSDTKAAAKVPAFDKTLIEKTWKYSSPLIACRFDPSGQWLFSAAQNQAIQRWNLADGSATELIGHQSWLRAIGFSPDSQTLYSGGYDGQLIAWNATDQQPTPRQSVEAHHGWIRSLAVSPDGSMIATAGNDLQVKLWDASTLSLIRCLEGHESHIYSLLFHPDGQTLLSGDLTGKIHQWKVDSGELQRTLGAEALHTYNGGQGAHYGGVRSMSLSPDGKALACGGLHNASNPFGAVQEPLVVLIDWSTGQATKQLIGDAIPQGIVWRVGFHASGTLLGTSGGGSGGFLLFWDTNAEKPMHQFKLPNTSLDMDLHPDGKQVATVHFDRHVRLSLLQ
jgi:WD40 repeat protein